MTKLSTSERSFGKTLKSENSDRQISDEVDDSLKDETISVDNEAAPNMLSSFLFKTCLHPRLSLKHQLFLSFGVLSTVSLLFVMIVSIVTARKSGDHVKNLSRANLERWSEEKLGVSVRIIAETIAKEMESMESLPAVMVETAKDRFVGYPDHPGYADDSLVPFRDMVSGKNIYPLTASAPLPLDWAFEPLELTDENAQEHVQDRKEWYVNDEISTATATIRMQGGCDPFETDSTAKRFYPNCTDAHNNLTTGGVVAPTITMDLIHKKSSDFAGAVLKPLYEASRNSKNIGFYFANSGAGAVIAYPAMVTDSTTSYVSIGCDWMLEPNPMNISMTIGTEEEVARCHPAGTVVFNREYNPLEREWCKLQALDPSKSSSYGPYKDAFTHDMWLLTFGRAIYDRVTDVFIGCTLVDVSVEQASRVLRNFSISNTSEIAFINWNEEGTVVASERWNTSEVETTTSISALGMGVSKQLFVEMKERVTSSYHSQSEYSPIFVSVGKVFAFYPVPVPPKVYDIDYAPAFAILLSVDTAEIFGTVNDLDDAVEEDVWELIRIILIAGFAGIIAVILCIYVVSLYLTRPMEWMNDVGDQIVQSMGSHDQLINFEPSAWLRYTPQTEIKLLMQQFHKTVERFSGQGTAKLHMHKGIEVKNPFELIEIFESLYLRRGTPVFKYNYEENGSKYDSVDSVNSNRARKAINRMHWGPNFNSADGDTTQMSSLHQELELANGNKNILISPLFWWILGAITIPLVITMIVISVYVTWNISNKLPTLVVAVEDAYVAFEKRSLYPLAKARSDFAESVMTPSFRDIHMFSRITGWVFFGGIQKAKSVTAMATGAEDCKSASLADPASCSYSLNRSKTPCDCKWNRKNQVATRSCTKYEEDSRYLQQLWWYGSNLDIWPNGDINSTSYPEVATSPGNTSWWSDWNAVPGFELGFDAANSTTTYEDLLSLSALSMVLIPLFNYQSDGLSEGTIGAYLAFEDNGIFSGYSGCDYVHAFASQFLSDEKSAAFQINPKLCPLGKYGYDPRCRSWYLGGQLTNAEGKDPLYVSPPYLFALEGYIGQSMSLPLQEDGEYLGQALLDFNIVPILDALTQEETPLNGNGFHVLIATTRYNFGTDIVVGPGFDLQEDLQQGSKHEIEQSVLPYDVCDSGINLGCENLFAFRDIYEDMRAGLSGATSFTRTTASGGSEIVYWAYSPVKMFAFSPLSNSNFSQGVANYHTTVFSLALAETEQGLYDAFNSVEEELDRTVKSATIVLSVMIVLTLLCVVVMSARVTMSIIFPVYRLLHLVTSINTQEFNDDIPKIHDGSCEVTKVHDTFEQLYMVVRFANTAFFSGDLETAYETLQHALALFTKLHNDKAIGVANNNLGNTMLTMYRTMKKTSAPCIFGLTQTDVITNGNTYFKNTIDRGEEALTHISKEEGWSSNYLIFMQQLSNRYFNRAIFLLTTKEDHPNPEETEIQGFTDLSTSKDMDREVVDNGDDRGFKGDCDVHFELLLGRIKGILHILDLGYTDEWGVDELIEDARKELVGALREPGNILFRSVEPAGQMQRFDAALIQYYLNKNEIEKAALIAIRMLIEDDYVIAEAAIWAIKALNDYVPKLKAEDLGGEYPSDVQSSLFQYRQRITEMMSMSTAQLNIGKSGRDIILMRESAKQSCYGDVSMEVF